jgi:hypothetical protein
MVDKPASREFIDEQCTGYLGFLQRCGSRIFLRKKFPQSLQNPPSS